MRVLRHPRPGQPDTAIAVGSFDGVHRGHAALLGRLGAEAAARGLQSAVLTFEPLPREFFAPAEAPARLTSMRERLCAFAGLGIDRAYLQRFDAAFAALRAEDFERRL